MSVVDSDASFAAKVAHRLQVAFDARELHATSVAEDLSISAAAVRKWLRTGKVRIENLIEFSDLYGISLEWLLAGRGPVDANELSQSTPGGHGSVIPVLPVANAALGADGELDYAVSERLAVFCEDDPACDVAFRITDDALVERAPAGALLVCSTEREPLVGDIVVGVLARDDGSMQLVAREKIEPHLGDIIFRSTDPRYPDIPPSCYRIIATATEVRIPTLSS